jgi:hypothetical protein
MTRILIASLIVAAVCFPGGGTSAQAAEGAPARKTTEAIYRLNCGATEDYTDKAGHVWKPDTPYRDQVNWANTTNTAGKMPIKNSDDPYIYQTEAFGDLFYDLKVPNGSYRVVLHFAETTYKWWMKGYTREFDVLLQDKVVLPGFKPLKEAGGMGIPVVKEFKGVKATDGMIKIGLVPFIDNPGICGIEIYPE